MRVRRGLAIVLSAIGHGFFLWILFNGSPSPPLLNETIQLELIPPAGQQSSPKNKASKRGLGKGRGLLPQDLFPNRNLGDGETPALHLSSSEAGTGSAPHAQSWGAQQTFERLASLSPFLERIGALIESHIVYEDDLVQKYKMGAIAVDVETSETGVLKHFRAHPEGPDSLRGLVISAIQKALARPTGYRGPIKQIHFTVQVQFLISHPRENVVHHERYLEGNQIFIFKYAKSAAQYDLTEQSDEENIWTRLFGKRKPDLVNPWDFNRRTSALLEACDIHQDPDICQKAGENLVALNRLVDAQRVFDRLCDNHDVEACKTAATIRSVLRTL